MPWIISRQKKNQSPIKLRIYICLRLLLSRRFTANDSLLSLTIFLIEMHYICFIRLKRFCFSLGSQPFLFDSCISLYRSFMCSFLPLKFLDFVITSFYGWRCPLEKSWQNENDFINPSSSSNSNHSPQQPWGKTLMPWENGPYPRYLCWSI